MPFGIFSLAFLLYAEFFFNISYFFLFFFQEYDQIRVKHLDPDQDRRSVGPDLDSNCLQKLSADLDDTRR